MVNFTASSNFLKIYRLFNKQLQSHLKNKTLDQQCSPESKLHGSTVFPESKPHGSGDFCQTSERVVYKNKAKKREFGKSH